MRKRRAHIYGSRRRTAQGRARRREKAREKRKKRKPRPFFWANPTSFLRSFVPSFLRSFPLLLTFCPDVCTGNHDLFGDSDHTVVGSRRVRVLVCHRPRVFRPDVEALGHQGDLSGLLLLLLLLFEFDRISRISQQRRLTLAVRHASVRVACRLVLGAWRLRFDAVPDPCLQDSSYAGYKTEWAAMRDVLEAKFIPGTDETARLVGTGQAVLVEHNERKGRDIVWSDDVDVSRPLFLYFPLVYCPLMRLYSDITVAVVLGFAGRMDIIPGRAPPSHAPDCNTSRLDCSCFHHVRAAGRCCILNCPSSPFFRAMFFSPGASRVDRGTLFTSAFYRELHRLLGTSPISGRAAFSPPGRD